MSDTATNKVSPVLHLNLLELASLHANPVATKNVTEEMQNYSENRISNLNTSPFVTLSTGATPIISILTRRGRKTKHKSLTSNATITQVLVRFNPINPTQVSQNIHFKRHMQQMFNRILDISCEQLDFTIQK